MKRHGQTVSRIFFTFLAILCLSAPCFSEEKIPTNYNISKLSANLNNLSGAIGFERFNLLVGIFRSDFKTQEFAIHTDQDSIIAENDFTRLELFKNNSDILRSSTVIQIDDANFIFTPKEMLKLNFERLAFEMGNGMQAVNHLSLQCNGPANDLGKQQLQAFLESSLIKASKIEVDNKSSDTFLSLFPKGVMAGMSKERLSLMPKEFSDIFLQIEKGQTYLELSVRFLVKIKFKVWAEASEDTHDGRKLVLKINKACAWIFPIKDLLLKAIAKAKIANLTVEGNNVIIKL
ncbi:MAG: hypothetical protein A2X86_03395 [Bdellovibrionales bacterium GWA2_49_15]|nr:MAG: hypothetical protein A2X86_03395 [Bdellovibrionales bacterium GWA2_49_15]HAZ12260.1 hypothetical protein [Bdellovibrionales bacterium]